MNENVLPDSRMASPTGVIRIEFGEWGRLNMQPIFCANCGKLGAYVPEANMTFAFWLCDHPCADQWATLAGTYTTTDEVFFATAAQEMLEQYGHFLTEEEILKAEVEKTGSFAKLLKESPNNRVRR